MDRCSLQNEDPGKSGLGNLDAVWVNTWWRAVKSRTTEGVAHGSAHKGDGLG